MSGQGLQFHIELDIAGAVFLLMIFIFLRVQYRDTEREIASFCQLTVFAAITAMLDVVTAFLISYATSLPPLLCRVLYAAYYVCQTSVAYFFMAYIANMIDQRTAYGAYERRVFPAKVLLCITVAIAVLNLFFGFFYSFDSVTGFSYGPLFWAMFVLPLIIVFYSAWLVFAYRNVFGRFQTSMLVLFFAVAIGGVAIRVIILPNFRTDSFFYAIGVFGIFLSIETPNYRQIYSDLRSSQLDGLTRVYNRKAGEERIEELVSSEDAWGFFLMTDLDGFKEVNDVYGHQVGDEVLREYARILRSLSRDNDVICRYGGDEFVVYYDEFGSVSALSQRCLDIIARTESILDRFEESTRRVQVSVSIGISRPGVDGRTFKELFKAADEALYYVKLNGRGDYCFYSSGGSFTLSVPEGACMTDVGKIQQIFLSRERMRGTYQVTFEDFKNIYCFVMRARDRREIDAQLVLLTLHSDANWKGEGATTLIEGEHHLRIAIKETFRRGDVAAHFGPGQFLLLLLNATEGSDVHVVSRITSQWRLVETDPQIHLSCDSQPLRNPANIRVSPDHRVSGGGAE